MRLGVFRLQPDGLQEFRPCLRGLAGLQQYQSKAVVSFRKLRLSAHQFTKTLTARTVSFCWLNTSQLDTRIRALWIQADRLVQFMRRLVEVARLPERVIVMSFGQIEIRHNCLMKLAYKQFVWLNAVWLSSTSRT